MKQSQTIENPQVPVIAQALCEDFSGGKRSLYATELSSEGAFILSLQPPPVGSLLYITFTPQGLSALPPFKALVVSTQLYPNEVDRSGFTVLFHDPAPESLRALRRALGELGLPGGPPSEEDEPKRMGERRSQPRVHTDYKAEFSLLGREFHWKVKNLSMSGALLEVSEASIPIELMVGSRFTLNLIDESRSEKVTVEAEIARVVQREEIYGMGVQFVEVSPRVGAKIESIILKMLAHFASTSEEA